MSLSFLSLSPIPALKLTDQGLVDAVNMKLTSLFAELVPGDEPQSYCRTHDFRATLRHARERLCRGQMR